MRFLLVAVIRIYQWCIKPLIGETCRFHPSCSEYTLEAIKKYGAIKGGWMGLKRIVSCNPWNDTFKKDSH